MRAFANGLPARGAHSTIGAIHHCTGRRYTVDSRADAVNHVESGPTEEGTVSTDVKTRTQYHRRSSDPQTLRERGDFQRDLKYSKRRPLPDAPWRQVKAKTYLDDAERLYGRKELWHRVEDDVLREKLVTILQDYLRDTISAVRLESRDALKYRRLCDRAAKEYRAHIVAGAYASPDMLRAWAQRMLTSSASNLGMNSSFNTFGSITTDTHGDDEPNKIAHGAHSGETTSGTNTETEVDAQWLESRQRRGREAVVEGTPAMSDLPRTDAQRPTISAFPFLRQRAVEDEHSLDPSLVDWTAKYFPEDTTATFATPPKLRQRGLASDADDGSDGLDPAALSTPPDTDRGNDGGGQADLFRSHSRAHARHRLQSSLLAHNDRNRATFDAEGAFFHVRRQTEESERAPKPKPVRGSDETFARGSGNVVKVPWGVVSAAKQRGYSTDTLRAKERLVRLSRGEDPETIP